jgi:hypothetical protein
MWYMIVLLVSVLIDLHVCPKKLSMLDTSYLICNSRDRFVNMKTFLALMMFSCDSTYRTSQVTLLRCQPKRLQSLPYFQTTFKLRLSVDQNVPAALLSSVIMIRTPCHERSCLDFQCSCSFVPGRRPGLLLWSLSAQNRHGRRG